MDRKRWILFSVAHAVAVLVGGCGSGNLALNPTNLKVDAGQNRTARAGETIVLRGTAWDQTQKISRMTWSVSRASGAEDRSELPLVANADCGDYSPRQEGDYRDVRECAATVTLPNSPYTETYLFELRVDSSPEDSAASGSGGGGTSASAKVTVTVSPFASNGLHAELGPDFAVLYGAEAALRCRVYGGFVYPESCPQFQFVQTDRSGVAVPLSVGAPTGANAEGGAADGCEASASFTAPELSRDTNLTFECRVTDGAGAIAVATQTVRIVSLPPIQASAGPVIFGYPGQELVLDAGGTSDPACASQRESCPLYFHWEQVDHRDDLPVTWIEPNSVQGRLFAPDVTDRTSIRMRVYVDRRPVDMSVSDPKAYQSADTFLVVDQFPALTVSAGADLTAKPGEKVLLTASVDLGGANSPVHYRWRQLTGEQVALEDADRREAAFTVPTSAGKGDQFAFRVSVSRQSIDGTTVFAATEQDDVVVRVQ